MHSNENDMSVHLMSPDSIHHNPSRAHSAWMMTTAVGLLAQAINHEKPDSFPLITATSPEPHTKPPAPLLYTPSHITSECRSLPRPHRPNRLYRGPQNQINARILPSGSQASGPSAGFHKPWFRASLCSSELWSKLLIFSLE